jgi:uncharacterized alpha/beta hydrolase family protein
MHSKKKTAMKSHDKRKAFTLTKLHDDTIKNAGKINWKTKNPIINLQYVLE